MKKIVFIFLLLLNLICYSNNNNKIIIALSLNDCLSCLMPLNEINQALNHPEMTIVLKSHLQSDSLLVNKKIGINNYKSSITLYSDSLHNRYANGIKSTINIVKNNEKIYSSNLYQLDVNEFIRFYLNNEDNCFKNVKSGVRYIQDDFSLLVRNFELGRWSYYDSSTSIDIIPDKEWLKKAYSIYYKENNFDKHYNDFLNLLIEHPNLEPSITHGRKINANQIAFLTTVYFVKDNPDSKNTNITQEPFLIIYNIQERKIDSMQYINLKLSKSLKDYSINIMDFNVVGNDYLITLVSNNYENIDNRKYLSLFTKSKYNDNELVLKEIINSDIPNNYIKYKLYHNLHSYRFDKSLILLYYGEYIYDYKKNVKYKIPFSEEEFAKISTVFQAYSTGKTSTYLIDDIADRDNTILLLYRNSSEQLKLMEIEKKTEKVLKDKIIMTTEELKPHFSSWFTVNAKGEIHYLNNKNCIIKIQT